MRSRSKIHEDLELSNKPMSSRRSIIKKVGPGTPEVMSEVGRGTLSISQTHKSRAVSKESGLNAYHLPEPGPFNAELVDDVVAIQDQTSFNPMLL